MLPSNHIPQYREPDYPESWQRFLDKAAKGSCKAVDILHSAYMAYMVALTGDDQAPEEMHLDEFRAVVDKRFPARPLAQSPQELFNLGFSNGYFLQELSLNQSPRLPASAYLNLWARKATVPYDALVNDAVLTCFTRWSSDLHSRSLDMNPTDYDSLAVVTAMLALCFTWPEAEPTSLAPEASDLAD